MQPILICCRTQQSERHALRAKMSFEGNVRLTSLFSREKHVSEATK